MTKQEMILEMLAPIRWSDKTKADHMKRAMKVKKDRIEEVYRFFNDTDKTSKDGWFCICCL